MNVHITCPRCQKEVFTAGSSQLKSSSLAEERGKATRAWVTFSVNETSHTHTFCNYFYFMCIWSAANTHLVKSAAKHVQNYQLTCGLCSQLCGFLILMMDFSMWP